VVVLPAGDDQVAWFTVGHLDADGAGWREGDERPGQYGGDPADPDERDQFGEVGDVCTARPLRSSNGT
jgi:hypothetical protein